MDHANPTRDGREPSEEPRCEEELHIRLCARRVPSGHVEYSWRIEAVDNIGEDAWSLRGRFGPFDMPHEIGQQVAASVREWHKQAHGRIIDRSRGDLDYEEGEQLTLRDFLRD